MKSIVDIRKLAEIKAAQLPDNMAKLSESETKQMIHELQVHQIELEMQNNELLKCQVELDASKTRYFDLYDTAPIGYFSVDDEGMIIECNLTLANMLNTTRNFIVKSPFSKFIEKDNQDIYYKFRKELIASQETLSCELQIKTSNNAQIWVQLTATPVIDKELGTLLRIVVNDITERKQIEDIQLFLATTSSGKNVESFFNVLAEFLAERLGVDFVCIDRLEGNGLDARTVAVWCDGHFEDNVTYALKDTPCGDVVGKSVCCFPASVCQFFPDDQVLQDLKAESYAGVTLWSHTGQPIGLIAVIKRSRFDNQLIVENILKLVTHRAAAELERLEAEEEKDILQEQLHQALKMESIGRLAGGVAHDFNNMLQAILGNAELAMNYIPEINKGRENLEEIKKCADRSADLTRQLLAFARKQTVTPKVLNLNDAITGMLKMLHRLIGEDITLKLIAEANICKIKVDPSQIDQILVNLCINARDSITGVGTLTIETKNSLIDDGYCKKNPAAIIGEYVSISITDTGCGIKKEIIDNIFEPFFTTKDTGKGTGMGLATVYGICKQNNGFIQTNSELGIGTTFTIFLPQYNDDNEESDDVIELPVIRGKETILLVEDEISILKLVTAMLEKLGYTVLSTNSPGRAINIVKEYTDDIHLIFTDIIMPEMNGQDLVNKILQINPNIKTLLMSGYTADIIANQGMLEKGVNFITKPFTMKKMAAIVSEVIDTPDKKM
jgi:PAS domain S-box-containing protein